MDGQSSLSPPVIGIGASAGGLQAFTEFVQHMPANSGFAFVLIQHLDPQQPSLLPDLLASHTSMSVQPAIDQISVEPNHIYLIPPNTALTINQGVLQLEPPTEAHGQRLPINHFFRSLALDQGERAIGIVLSGTGADGALGLAEIHARGGLTLAQTPTSAAYAEMPQQAIAQGTVDHVLDIAAMPALLTATTTMHHAQANPVTSSTKALLGITSILQQATSHDFSHYKQTTLRRRIDRRMQLLHLTHLEDYHARLVQDRNEIDRLFQDLLISVTDFFRDQAAFEALASKVIPGLLRSKNTGMSLRVWVPGCASGEEAYSIAMLLREQAAQLIAPPLVQMFATDIDEVALAIARQGRYDVSITAHLSPERLTRNFIQEGQSYQVTKTIREMCLFSTHNLISDPPFGRMDLISCRNLLIYFDADLQRQLIPILHYALAPGGYLFLGSAESATSAANASELFRVIDAQHRIYQRKERLVHLQSDLPWTVMGRQMPRLTNASRRTIAPGTTDIGATLERILLRDYTPTAVAIDEQGAIAYLTGNTYPYLSVPAGAPTTNFLAMAHPDLRLPLRAAIRTITQEQVASVREDLTIATSDGLQRLTLTVRPLREPNADAGLLLIVMQAVGSPTPLSQLVDGQASSSLPTTALAQELQRTRDTLETTISELQMANLDLTAVNEELRSLNEELQATNEE
ncbi:MAG: hypothetical protein HGA19_01225, partial [Oscillochloris sp.]|nr:hypothetical protein [Oscillochloris sp.]